MVHSFKIKTEFVRIKLSISEASSDRSDISLAVKEILYKFLIF